MVGVVHPSTCLADKNIIRKTKRSEKIKRIVLSRKTKRLFLESPSQCKNASDFSGAFRISCPLYFRHSNRTSRSHHHRVATLYALYYSRTSVHFRGSALCSSAAGLSVAPSGKGGIYRLAGRGWHRYFVGRLIAPILRYQSGTVPD